MTTAVQNLSSMKKSLRLEQLSPFPYLKHVSNQSIYNFQPSTNQQGIKQEKHFVKD